MNIMDVSRLVKDKEYDLLRSPRMLVAGLDPLCVYGDYVEEADMRFIGCSTLDRSDILRGTTYYKVDKKDSSISMLSPNLFVDQVLSGNLSMLGLLGIDSGEYVKVSEWGKLLTDNVNLFLSRDIYSSLDYVTKAITRRIISRGIYNGHMASASVRMFYMVLRILEDGIVDMFQQDNKSMLLSLLKEDCSSTIEELIAELSVKCRNAYERCSLPSTPDYVKINSLLERINEATVVSAVA